MSGPAGGGGRRPHDQLGGQLDPVHAQRQAVDQLVQHLGRGPAHLGQRLAHGGERGETQRATGRSSNPMMDKSCGIRRPRCRAASCRPNACWSLPAKMADGGSVASSSSPLRR